MDLKSVQGTPMSVALLVIGGVGFLVALSFIFKGHVHF